MAKAQSRYVCQACGESFLRWEGQCRACGGWNTLVETLVHERPSAGARGGARAGRSAGGEGPVALRDLREAPLERHPTGIGELDRVLGGGLVPGSLVLLGGEPGIGKSTLVLEAAAGVARGAHPGREVAVLYASGEESSGQLRLRARRLGLADDPAGERVHVLAETDVERIIEHATAARPDLLIVDSIQTVTLDALDGPAGSVGQVREAAARLLGFAKGSGVPVVLVGHVTKDGALAGPKTLEHLVDAVLALEGERFGTLRLLRASKNRFGSTEEVGVLEMAGDGLREVPDPARAFLGPATDAAGTAVAATLEGSRPLLVEVQALVAPAGGFGAPRRTVSGLEASRLALIVAVLARRVGLDLGGQDIYASLAGGLSVAEPALDLPLALALASSFRDAPVAAGTVSMGEVGLLGELRTVGGLERRLREAARLGFTRAVIPAGVGRGRVAAADGLELVPAATLQAALQASLGPARRRRPGAGS
ncbi:MAG TPA: DNA repair protein RadA [Candidatus Sulfotelmatobacter sp.]|nr:DNA repair protein RadA [Candidatus Sulfotelmatobacter sp.]